MADSGLAVPKHAQLRFFLEGEISGGRYLPGDLLPSEPELMERFGLSRGTVRKAYDSLVAAGLVERGSGRGSFVSQAPKKVRIGVLAPSAGIFERGDNPADWEINADKLNGVFTAAVELRVEIEVIPYASALTAARGHRGHLLFGKFPKLEAALAAIGKPYLRLLLDEDAAATDAVVFDLRRCFGEALEYFLGRGFRAVGFIGYTDPLRLGAYQAALAARGIPFDAGLIECEDTGLPEGGNAAAAALFKRRPEIDAVFCTTDLRAMGVLDFLRGRGVEVPGQVSVMGFDNIRESALTDPPLTTYQTPRRECGARALRLLVAKIRNEAADSAANEGLAGKLIERQSVRQLGNSM